MKKVVLTFDDAYLSHYIHAFPLLKKYGFSATFYVCVDWVGRTINNRQFMSWEQIQDMLNAGFDIGNHFFKHLAMPKETEEKIGQMIQLADQKFEEHGIKPVSICYPGFHVNETVKKIVAINRYKFARAGLPIPEGEYVKGGSGIDYHHRKDDALEAKCKGVFGEEYGYDEFVKDVETIPDQKNVYGIFAFHDLTGFDKVHVPLTVFEYCLEYLKQNHIEVLSIKKILG